MQINGFFFTFTANQTSLEKDVDADIGGDFQNLLIAILQGRREETSMGDNINELCELLLQAGEK